MYIQPCLHICRWSCSGNCGWTNIDDYLMFQVSSGDVVFQGESSGAVVACLFDRHALMVLVDTMAFVSALSPHGSSWRPDGGRELWSAADLEQCLAFVGMATDGYTFIVHRIQKVVPRVGMPATRYDNQYYGTLQDVEDLGVTTVQVTADYFALEQNQTFPTIDSITQAAAANQAGLLGPMSIFGPIR